MGGLMSALAGGLEGLGDGMIERAKEAREDKLIALKRSQQVEDRDAGFAQQDKTLAATEAGANQRSQDSNNTSILTTQMSQTGANTRAKMSEDGANSRTAATIHAEGDRQAAGFAHDDKTAASTFSDVKTGRDGTLVAINKNGQAKPVVDADGAPVIMPNSRLPPSVATAIIKTFTSVDPNTGQPVIVNQDAMFDTLSQAEARLGGTDQTSGTYIRRGASSGGMFPSSTGNAASLGAPMSLNSTGGLTSGLSGSAAPAPSFGSQITGSTGSGAAPAPVVATSQSDIDNFKQNAPPGAVIIINGQKYTK